MRYRLALVAGALAVATALPMAASPPKLAVIIVVDQMRADYVDRFQSDWSGGLKRLVSKGAWFRRAAYPYLDTVTCAGHSTIATGAFPAAHGVFNNAWFDRGKNAIVTCTDDPTVKAVAYGRGNAGSESPVNLRLPTFADEMRRQRNAHVVSLSLKARSAIMLAGHGGDSVTWLSESLDGWETSTTYTSAPVPVVQSYVSANPIEADLGKIWKLSLPSNRYRERDTAIGEAPPEGWSASFPHQLKGLGTSATADAAFYAQWERSPFADAYLGRMASALVESMALGKHDTTDVLAVSFSSPDLVGHAFGPRSREVQDMYAQLDHTIGLLLDTLDRLVGPNEYVVALTSDHGVAEIPEQARAQKRDAGRIVPAAVASAVGRAAESALASAPVLARISGNNIYLPNGIMEKLVANPGALKAVLTAAQSQDGVQRAFYAGELVGGTTSSDMLLRAAALSYVPGRSGDIIIAPKAGWMSGTSGTTHGSANSDDQRVPILFYGKGIKAGRLSGPATPADVAPTLAAVVGITMPQAQGTVLSSALTDAAAVTSTAASRP